MRKGLTRRPAQIYHLGGENHSAVPTFVKVSSVYVLLSRRLYVLTVMSLGFSAVGKKKMYALL